MRPGEEGELVFEDELEAQAAASFLGPVMNIAAWMEPQPSPNNVGTLSIVAARLGVRKVTKAEYVIRHESAAKATLSGLEIARFSTIPDLLGRWTLRGYLRNMLEQYQYSQPPGI